MAKFTAKVYERRNRPSEGNGAARVYRIDLETIKGLGQGVKVLFHGHVYSVGTNARMDIVVSTGCLGSILPVENGATVTLSGTYNIITAAGSFFFNTSSDLHSAVEVSASIYSTGGGNLTFVEFELWATVITQT